MRNPAGMTPAHEHPMRLGYVVKVYPRYSETFIVNEILAHEAAGHTVDIFSLRPPRETHFQDLLARVRSGVTYLGNGSLKAEPLWEAMQGALTLPGFFDGLQKAHGAMADEVHAALVLARAAEQRGIIHLHAHFATSATTVARIAAALAGLTYSFTAHAKDIFHDDVRSDDLQRKLTDAAAVVTVSDYNAAYLLERFRACAPAVRRVYNGLDLERFRYRPSQSCERRVVAVGRLVEKKGFSTLVDACRLLEDRGASVHCDIIGSGELEAALRAQIESCHLQQSVVLRGPMPQPEVVRMVSDADVLALPCVVGEDGNRDGLPTVLLEAMALGTPVVGTRVTGIPEVLEDGRTGVLVAERDADGLADAIERLLAHPQLRLRLAAAARKRIERDFDGRRSAAELRDIFAECAGIRRDVGVAQAGA